MWQKTLKVIIGAKKAVVIVAIHKSSSWIFSHYVSRFTICALTLELVESKVPCSSFSTQSFDSVQLDCFAKLEGKDFPPVAIKKYSCN